MNEQEKSVKLAELMEWEEENGFIHNVSLPRPEHLRNPVERCDDGQWRLNPLEKKEWDHPGPMTFCPYSDNFQGRIQFSAILMKFPDVLFGSMYDNLLDGDVQTRSDVLDEILRMNGVYI